jgi:hypothetical protein
MPQASSTWKRDGRPLEWLTWPFSLLLPIALLLLLVSLAVTGNDPRTVVLTVRDENGEPLPQARVVVDDELFLTDANGGVRLEAVDATKDVTVWHEGYVTMVGTLEENTSSEQEVVLQAEKNSNAMDTAMAEKPFATTLVGQESGTQQQDSTPAATASPIGESNTASKQIAGTVTDGAGEPVGSAWVTDGETFVFTDAKGVFLFEEGAVDEDETLTVFGSGYQEKQVPVPAEGSPLHVMLQMEKIRGIYYNPNISSTQEDVDTLIEIANTTEVNAIVVDIKEELVFYDTQVQFFRDAGTVHPVLDLPSILKQFQDNDIYTIARLVVFKDSAVAEKFPYLGVKDNITGDLWRDMNGVAWVNPMLHELWGYNIELAYEAATMGFDEIQYDYVRFPTDGDMSRVAYGLENSQANREKSIETFLQRSHERLIPTGTKLSADIFGYTVMVQDDLGIGQNLDQLAPHVDYLSPMIYPSHWPEGSMGLEGHPNDSPYETIKLSMSLAMEQLGGSGLQLRPWLQDFNMPGMMEYGDAEVRAQIDAVEDLGLAGWLIWDPNNWYHEGAFKPESNTAPQATPAASPRPVTTGFGTLRGRRC